MLILFNVGNYFSGYFVFVSRSAFGFSPFRFVFSHLLSIYIILILVRRLFLWRLSVLLSFLFLLLLYHFLLFYRFRFLFQNLLRLGFGLRRLFFFRFWFFIFWSLFILPCFNFRRLEKFLFRFISLTLWNDLILFRFLILIFLFISFFFLLFFSFLHLFLFLGIDLASLFFFFLFVFRRNSSHSLISFSEFRRNFNLFFFLIIII